MLLAGVDAEAGAAASAAPQLLQKRAKTEFSVPHTGHGRPSAVPQLLQKRCSRVTGAPQFGHGKRSGVGNETAPDAH
jgi:hypothetical protein